MALVLIGVGYGVIAGFFEELGWSGFAMPETRKQGHGIVTTGLTVGLMWGLWHFLVALWGSGTEDGSFSFDLFIPWIPWNLLVLPCFRVLMVLLYERTQSIPSMSILHGSLTASLPLILMPPATGYALSGFYTILAAVLGIAIVVLVNGYFLERTKTD
jgi:membrane protease YdiL (CAAX protease family)